ncbi:Serine/threonine protein kinase [Selenomonas ruminantium]|uniref:non-specific serine/threonine protein kinase n=1 Tax=Selenomonas ruminantium TaxID=971 RepID=A0A1M6QY14_SELRU|nr:serine/threonine-protein kinase [Selenomonas ruminantium]SHK25066.1 Serine/threonine protein kinase [Selenomonas ruminantium]
MQADHFLASTYEKIRLLKKSARSEVWLVTDKQGTLAILKHSQPHRLPLQELKTAAIPLLPKIYYLISHDEETITIEEYIHGQSLADRLQTKNYLTEQEASQLLLSICHGLAQLHALGIIHRDIKPEHIIVEKDNTPRLIDFDACRSFKDGQTEDTALLGTKTYAPPEQFGFQQTDPRSDIYALGKTIQELLPPDYNGRLLPILQRCQRLDPADRYQNTHELSAALQRTPRRLLFIIPVLLLCALLMFFCLTQEKFSYAPTATTTNEQSPAESPSLPEKKSSAPTQSPAAQEAAPGQAPTPPTAPSPQPPQPVPPVQAANTIPPPTADTKPQPETDKNYIRTQYFRNGRRLDGWTENSSIPINNAGTTIAINPKFYAKQIKDSGKAQLSADDNATLRIINHSSQTWSNAYLTLHYSCQDKQDSQTIPIGPLAPGETTDIPIPLSQYPLIIPDISTQAEGELHIELTSDSPQEIHNSRYYFNLLYQP